MLWERGWSGTAGCLIIASWIALGLFFIIEDKALAFVTIGVLFVVGILVTRFFVLEDEQVKATYELIKREDKKISVHQNCIQYYIFDVKVLNQKRQGKKALLMSLLSNDAYQEGFFRPLKTRQGIHGPYDLNRINHRDFSQVQIEEVLGHFALDRRNSINDPQFDKDQFEEFCHLLQSLPIDHLDCYYLKLSLFDRYYTFNRRTGSSTGFISFHEYVIFDELHNTLYLVVHWIDLESLQSSAY